MTGLDRRSWLPTRRAPISPGGLLSSLCLSSLLLASPVAAEETWPLESVAPGVWAAVQPAEKRFSDSNSLVIVSERDVVVVDAQADAGSIERLHRSIVELTDKPIAVLVNTHWHSDHTQGNAVWRRLVGPQLEIVGHESLLEDVPRRAAVYLREQADGLEERIALAETALAEGRGLSGQQLDAEQQRQQHDAIVAGRERLAELRAVDFVLPSVVYRERLVLRRDSGDIGEIVLLHHRGHTRGDTVVWLPAQRVLATGDLLDELPYGGHGYPTSWLASLRDLGELDFVAVVPGHGPVQRSRQRLELVEELWSTLIGRLGESARAGRSLEEARSVLQLDDLRRRLTVGDPVAERAWEEFLPSSIERVWNELNGSLED